MGDIVTTRASDVTSTRGRRKIIYGSLGGRTGARPPDRRVPRTDVVTRAPMTRLSARVRTDPAQLGHPRSRPRRTESAIEPSVALDGRLAAMAGPTFPNTDRVLVTG